MENMSELDRYLMEHGYLVPPKQPEDTKPMNIGTFLPKSLENVGEVGIPEPATANLEELTESAPEVLPSEVTNNAAPQTAGAIPSIPVSSSLSTVPFQLPPALRLKRVVIDFALAESGNPADFTVTLSEPLRGVVAIRPLAVELVGFSGSKYIAINDWVGLAQTKNATTPFFMHVVANEYFPAVSTNLETDPYVHLFQPVEARLDKLRVRILNADGTSPNYSLGSSPLLSFAVYFTGKSY